MKAHIHEQRDNFIVRLMPETAADMIKLVRLQRNGADRPKVRRLDVSDSHDLDMTSMALFFGKRQVGLGPITLLSRCF